MSLTKHERDFARHALGLDRRRVGYRNFYSVGDGEDLEIGRALVSKGFAVELGRSAVRSASVFVITASGFEAAKNAGEKMDAEEAVKMAGIGVAAQPVGGRA